MIADGRKNVFKINHPSLWLLCILIFSICACDSEIQKTETVILDGIVCQKSDKDPYSGFVTGKERKGGRGKVYQFKKQYKDGILNGKVQYFHRNGKLESSVPYKKGKIHGMVSTYYDSGQIRSRIHYVNGTRGGSKGEIFWDKNGKVRRG